MRKRKFMIKNKSEVGNSPPEIIDSEVKVESNDAGIEITPDQSVKAENDELQKTENKILEFSNKFTIEFQKSTEEIIKECQHLKELYKENPAEQLRAILAFLEYSVTQKNNTFDRAVQADFVEEIYSLIHEIDTIDPLDKTKVSDIGTYMVYLNHLGLSEDDLREGVILDVGAGNRHFAGHCLRSDISSEVFSIDPYIRQNKEEQNYLNHILRPGQRGLLDLHTVKGTADSIPFPDETFDKVVVNAGGAYTDQKGIEHSTGEYGEICRVLKVGGEFRTNAYPTYVREPNEDDSADSFQVSNWKDKIKVDKQLDILRKTGNFEIRVEAADGKTDKTTFGRLIIKKIR